MIISGKLLSLILGYYAQPSHEGDNTLYYSTKSYKYTGHNINLDTLGRLCKEWCFDNKYVITTLPLITEKDWKKHAVRLYHMYSVTKDNAIVETVSNGWFKADSEVESIIAATTWVAKEEGSI